MSMVEGNSIFDPFSSFDIYDALFSDADLLSDFVSGISVFADAKIDWKETADAHVFKADLPGVKKDELTVAVEGSVLRISGERSEEEEKSDMWHRHERSSGKFLRRFRLPNDANADEVQASMLNGVLTVIVPKMKVKSQEAKIIKVSG